MLLIEKPVIHKVCPPTGMPDADCVSVPIEALVNNKSVVNAIYSTKSVDDKFCVLTLTQSRKF